jgi:hypothetical protein
MFAMVSGGWFLIRGRSVIVAHGLMVIRCRSLDWTVWSAMVNRWTLAFPHRSDKSSSFAALERSSGGVPDMATSASSGKTSTAHRSWRKRTRKVTKDIERFEGVRTLRHQIHYRLDIFGETRRCDPGEVETTREAQQSTCERADIVGGPQVEGPGELGRGRRSVPSITSGAERNHREILEEGKGTYKI